jgi:myo-inositol 2-dehydrogenase/D-chiro-inositol 1-dehydrogenase
MKPKSKGIGLAIVGGGRMGLFRGGVARRHLGVDWIGLAEKNPERARETAKAIGADFVTADHRELLARKEVNAAIIATEEHLHVDPIMTCVAHGHDMIIEKPLAIDLGESERVLAAVKKAKVDATLGYTQRFRRKWLSGKGQVETGALGDVTMVTSRVLMNRLVALECLRRSNRPDLATPMVVSGTHALDVVMWYMEKKTPVEVYARSVDTVFGKTHGGIDGTAGQIIFSDGSIYHLSINWALPVVWPGAVYSLDVSIVGTGGVLTIDDTHRDMVMAVTSPQSVGYAPDKSRLVDFLGSYPPGDIVQGELRGPMRDETDQWLTRLALGVPSVHATVDDGHSRLMLTKALDLSAKLKKPVKLPLTAETERELLGA